MDNNINIENSCLCNINKFWGIYLILMLNNNCYIKYTVHNSLKTKYLIFRISKLKYTLNLNLVF